MQSDDCNLKKQINPTFLDWPCDHLMSQVKTEHIILSLYLIKWYD